MGRSSSNNRDPDFESGRGAPFADSPAVGLQEIAMKCGTKVLNIVYLFKLTPHICAIFFVVVSNVLSNMFPYLFSPWWGLICFFKHVYL